MDCSDQTVSVFCILNHLNWDGVFVTGICADGC